MDNMTLYIENPKETIKNTIQPLKRIHLNQF